MGVDIFKNSTKSLPKKDPQIERIDFEKSDLGARKEHMPPGDKSAGLAISHVGNKNGS